MWRAPHPVGVFGGGSRSVVGLSGIAPAPAPAPAAAAAAAITLALITWLIGPAAAEYTGSPVGFDARIAEQNANGRSQRAHVGSTRHR
jgi:hypothetical protein